MFSTKQQHQEMYICLIRKIIKIDEGKCNGCGACVAACHEGAIEMENGKAKNLPEWNMNN